MHVVICSPMLSVAPSQELALAAHPRHASAIVYGSEAGLGINTGPMTRETLQAVSQAFAVSLQQSGRGVVGTGGGEVSARGETFRMWKYVADTAVRRMERLAATGFQDWGFRFEAAVEGCNQNLGILLHWQCIGLKDRGVVSTRMPASLTVTVCAKDIFTHCCRTNGWGSVRSCQHLGLEGWRGMEETLPKRPRKDPGQECSLDPGVCGASEDKAMGV